MAGDNFQEKTEPATPKRREKAREQGQVSKSKELSSVAVLLVGICCLYIFGYFFYSKLITIMRAGFSFESIPDVTPVFLINLLKSVMMFFFVMVMPLFGAVFFTALGINIYQVGFKFSAKPIEFKLSAFNIVKGFKKFFALKSLVELLKSLIKIIIISMVAYHVIKEEMNGIFQLYDSTVGNILVYILKGIFKIFIWVLLVMVVVAVADYAYQKWQFEKDLKMTKQEVKEETKQTEGDPLIKSKIRSIQIQAARRRMMQEVPTADVVVTNPTRLALAIRYDPMSMTSPQLKAKGAGQIAERIRAIARENNVPLVENKELARNLYKLMDIDDEIPTQFYRAVAEILAYVYKLKGKTV